MFTMKKSRERRGEEEEAMFIISARARNRPEIHHLNSDLIGNTNDDNNKPKLTKVSLIHLDDKNQEVVQDVWTGQDEILRVSAIQQDLTKLKTRDLPNTFWFR